MKIKVGIVLLSALLGVGGTLLLSPEASAATVNAAALAQAAKASPIVQEVGCFYRTRCPKGPHREGCQRVRICRR
jgi:hypothetical protein